MTKVRAFPAEIVLIRITMRRDTLALPPGHYQEYSDYFKYPKKSVIKQVTHTKTNTC